MEKVSSTTISTTFRAKVSFEIFQNVGDYTPERTCAKCKCPTTEYRMISINLVELSGENQLFLYSVDGRLIHREEFSNNTIINTSDLPTGVYIYKINGIRGKFSKK